jgi:hypothetical protein
MIDVFMKILFCLCFLFVWILVLITLYSIFKYTIKTEGIVVYSKKYKRSQRFIYRNEELRPEYILNGEKMADWLNEIKWLNFFL